MEQCSVDYTSGSHTTQKQIMTIGINKILPLVEQPSRYLGSEINVIRKKLEKIDLHIVLAFPDLYEIGTSHFGMQILYHLLNQEVNIAAERVFTPGEDLEAHLRSENIPLVSLESQTPLSAFDIIGFSLLYELNYTNILTILELSNIPFFSKQRDHRHPLVIAGGPCTCNPEPVADFFDAMVIGDGERVMLEMTTQWLLWKKSDSGDRNALLNRWSDIQGVYIPAHYQVDADAEGPQSAVHQTDPGRRVHRAVVEDLDDTPFPDKPIIPFGKPVHDRLRLEVARGCTRGCRFCQAGMIYRPVRERSAETLLALGHSALKSTGYEDLSLLSLSTGDYECIVPLMQLLMARCAADHVAVSLPSLRAGTLTPELMRLIKKVRKTGFTIAPEAGSQRLRNVINKNITKQEIVETVDNAFRLGWQVIKLYFMIGLPTETEEDLLAIVDLVKDLRRHQRMHGPKGQINVSVATFIPKAHTPFQWAPQLTVDEARQRIQWLQDRLRLKGVKIKWQNPEVSHMEGLWARGDRRLAPLLVTAYRLGCRLDGWSDHFDYSKWLTACQQTGVDIDSYTLRPRDFSESLPWDHIDAGVTKAFLLEEWQQATEGGYTPDCRKGDCNVCGVCDFEKIAPKIFDHCTITDESKSEPEEIRSEEAFRTIDITYEKTGTARFFGHLEMMSIFIRALHRAGIRMKYTQGFHPKPKISFQDALPIGLESRCETFKLTVDQDVKIEEVAARLNRQLPEGLVVIGCCLTTPRASQSKRTITTYRVELTGGGFNQTVLDGFKKQTERTIIRKNRKGKETQIDLRQQITNLTCVSPSSLQLDILGGTGPVLRPPDVIRELFPAIETNRLQQARIIKTAIRPADSTGSSR